jgi:capsular polysaccharide transport system permease protein
MIRLAKIPRAWLVAVLFIVASTLYWGFFAADRYVSESHVIVENLQGPASAPTDLSSLITGGNAPKDILLLRDYLLSADMLRKLDADLNLREHYNGSYDVLSRMVSKDVAFEWFLRHYQGRVSVDYDEYAGLLVIKAQAYSPEMAHAIGTTLVREGERFMNELAHKLAFEQVAFAEREVEAANKRVVATRQSVLAYQNVHGLVSPSAAVESMSAVAAQLEGELARLEARRNALQSYLTPTAPDVVQVDSQVRAVQRQLKAVSSRLASSKGESLNRVAEEYERLAMEAGFQQDVYKTALSALERSRVDATRTLKKVSVLQAPTRPESALEPRRIYNITIFALATLLLTGIAHLLLAIVREHRD